MKKSICAGICVIVILTVFCVVFSRLGAGVSDTVRVYQHEENSAADSSIGGTEIAEDGTVDPDTFVTHLPLVIIDTDGEEIPNIYSFLGEEQTRTYTDENVTDPWVSAGITLIDNDNYENHITDEAAFENNGLIKLRGMSSRSFAKKQYGIKLLDENGGELEESLLGMDEDEDWVLSNSILDTTGIRNYMAYNIGGQIFPYTPEAKFCEVIFKEGDTYQYMGLYLLTEAVKKGDGHVEIENFDENAQRLSYLICRDRPDLTKTTLSTWASDSQLCYGWFTVKYPKEEFLTDSVVERIEADITNIEKILYSEDPDVFLTYSQYIDVDSFVDYFVFNEFFMNYDAGDNSTYYYQDSYHKLSMGPLWDYDNCWDNYADSVANLQYAVFAEQPWFEKLVQDPEFVQLVSTRYAQLRQTILSDEYIEEFVDDTVAYLGNAIYRDRSRWREAYEEEHMLEELEDENEFIIDRNRSTYEEEVEELLDTQQLHGAWLDENIYEELSQYINEDFAVGSIKVKAMVFIAFLVIFLALIVVVKRKVFE